MQTKRTLTQADADFLKGIFATKDDLNRFATKDDLNGFATKDDLNRFATRIDSIEQEEKYEKLLLKFRDDFYTKIGPILKEVTASREERVTQSAQHRRNEKRIEKLEEIHPQNKHLATI